MPARLAFSAVAIPVVVKVMGKNVEEIRSENIPQESNVVAISEEEQKKEYL